MIYKFSPNNFNYASCNRCFYLKHKWSNEIKGGFPEIFSALDISQKNYFIDKKTTEITEKLPEGIFLKTITKVERNKRVKNFLNEFNDNEIPARILSKELKDNKNRSFELYGTPDLVVKFKDSYGILDFKTTGTKDKTLNYRYQLESYCLIFENPKDGPVLTPFSHLGLIQFTPDEITGNDHSYLTQKMKINYYPLERNPNSLISFITEKIDILEQSKLPKKDDRCTICKGVDEYIGKFC